jgi:hypothetical protein
MAPNKIVHAIRRTIQRPELQGLWDGDVWADVPFLTIDHFRPEGSDHRPLTQCRLLYDDDRLYGLFRIRDRYVRCVNTGFQSPVWEDSCVEIFVQPLQRKGYFNFEFNCGGALLASYVTDPTRVGGHVAAAVPLSEEAGGYVDIYHNMPQVVTPEIEEEQTWFLEFALPFAILGEHIGDIGSIDGQTWRGNLYKCGNKTSHPHWASWSALSERNFHTPWDFGLLRFE